jgi:hypothetical protein
MKGGLDSNDCSACVVVVDEREITGFWIWREARGVWHQYILLVSAKDTLRVIATNKIRSLEQCQVS